MDDLLGRFSHLPHHPAGIWTQISLPQRLLQTLGLPSTSTWNRPACVFSLQVRSSGCISQMPECPTVQFVRWGHQELALGVSEWAEGVILAALWTHSGRGGWSCQDKPSPAPEGGEEFADSSPQLLSIFFHHFLGLRRQRGSSCSRRKEPPWLLVKT